MNTRKEDIPNRVGFPLRIRYRDGVEFDTEVELDKLGRHSIKYCNDNCHKTGRQYSNVVAWEKRA